MAVMRIQSDGDPYPARAGVTVLTNDGTTPRGGFGGGNTISDQTHDFQFEYRGGQNTSNPHLTTLGAMGIANNGVVLFNPSAAPGPLPGSQIQPPQGFTYNAVFNESAYGVDACGGHPEENGEYHYHSGSFLINGWNNAKFYGSNSYYNDSNYSGDNFRHPDGHSKILGWCFDGYPLYGPYSYADPADNTSLVRQMLSSWRTLATEATGRGFTYAQEPAGSFINDYEFVDGLGDLDEYNGRYLASTPDYPTGTYAYFLTFANGDFNTPAFPYIFGLSTREQRGA